MADRTTQSRVEGPRKPKSDVQRGAEKGAMQRGEIVSPRLILDGAYVFFHSSDIFFNSVR